jgi:hypothetical protein
LHVIILDICRSHADVGKVAKNLLYTVPDNVEHCVLPVRAITITPPQLNFHMMSGDITQH